LSAVRKRTQLARRQLGRTRRLRLTDEINQASNLYKKARADYVKEIRKSKMESWRNLVTTKGNHDPWGIVYRILRNKIRNDYNMFHAVREGDVSTLTWRDTATRLLKQMVPTNIENDDAITQTTVNIINAYSNFNLEPLITEDEVDAAIMKVKNNKAPGLDGLNPEILKRLWRVDKEILLILFNNCLRKSSFPELWRQAKLKPILKDIQKDPALTKSYRPIALLPVLGKLFERIIVNRIQDLYVEQHLDNDTQYGFKTGRSTDDALHRVITLVKDCQTKYATLIFFDIAGAFDNLWWPGILRRITKSNCSAQLFDIMRQYFNNRRMIITSRYDKVEKQMTKGCPQGSIIGPLAWNWAMYDLLNELETLEYKNMYATAYADDLALLVCERAGAPCTSYR